MKNLYKCIITDVDIKTNRKLSEQYYDFNVYVRITFNINRIIYKWRGQYK